MDSFVAAANKNFVPNPEEDVMDGLFRQYERVIFESLITSFGLDLFIKDQLGGDVDTLRTVDQIGKNPEMTYKSSANAQRYEDRGAYQYDAYHGKHENYRRMKADARKHFHETGEPVKDAYTGKELYFYTKGAAKGNSDKQASIDHVKTAHTIHEDRKRVLAGLKGEDLANDPSNLVFTNASLNSSMGGSKKDGEVQEIPDYVENNKNLSPDVKEKMKKEYDRANDQYEATLNRVYYTSPRFIKDSAKAAGKLGVKMGARQVTGFIFAEIWFAQREELKKAEAPLDLGKLLRALGEGFQKGLARAQEKYKELITKFIDGTTAGILSSLTTTLCNTFNVTSKNVNRLIRQSYASLTQAMNVLFLNPENLLFGERMRATSKILATGASVVVGVMVSEALEETGVGKIPVLGEIITTFCGTLVTGLMTCSLLCFLDRSPLINELAQYLDRVPTISNNVHYFADQAAKFETYAAEVMKIDVDTFQKEVDTYDAAADKLASVSDETELNRVLRETVQRLGIRLPWQGDFSDFMQDKSRHLVFE